MEISKAVTGCKLCQALGAGEIDTCQGDQVKVHLELHNYQLRLISKALSKGQLRKELTTATCTNVNECSQDQSRLVEANEQELIKEDEQILISKTKSIARNDLVLAHCRFLLTNKIEGCFVQCAQCRKKVKVISRSHLHVVNALQHVYAHLEKSLFACRHCEYGSSTKSSVRVHLQTKHSLRGDKHFIDLTPDYQSEIIEVITACFGQAEDVLQVQKAVIEDKILSCPSDQASENREDASFDSVPFDNAIDEQMLPIVPDQINVEQALAMVDGIAEQVLPIASDNIIVEQSIEDNLAAQATEGQSISVIAKDVTKEESKSDQNPIAKIDSIDDRVRALLKNRLQNDRVPCSECGFALKVAYGNEIDVSTIIDHVGQHLVKLLFACSLCNRKTCTKEAMRNHSTKHDAGASVIDLTHNFKKEIFEMLQRCFGQLANKPKVGSFQVHSGTGPQEAKHASGDEIAKPSEQPKAQGQSGNFGNFGYQSQQFWYEETLIRDFRWTTGGATAFPTGQAQSNIACSRPADASSRVGLTISTTAGGDPTQGFNRIIVDASGRMYDVLFLGEVAFIERNGYPHRVRFTGPPRTVLIDGYELTLTFEQPRTIPIDGQPRVIRFGAPSRELYLDSFPFCARFGGPPIRAKFNGVDHYIQLCGPPPPVKIDWEPAYDLLPYLRDSRGYGGQETGSVLLIDRDRAESLLSEIDHQRD